MKITPLDVFVNREPECSAVVILYFTPGGFMDLLVTVK